MRISSVVRNICSSFGNGIFSAAPDNWMKHSVGATAGPSRCVAPTRPSRPTIPTSAVSPSEVEPTIEATPAVIKYASAGTLPAVYRTDRNGSVTGVQCEWMSSRLSGESDANRRFSITVNMTSPSSVRKGLRIRQKITFLIVNRAVFHLL